jgi:hypothetical protein
MDFIPTAGATEFAWPSDVRRALQLKPEDVGVLGDFEIQDGGTRQLVHVPIELDTTQPAVTALVLPLMTFDRVERTTYRLGANGEPVVEIAKPVALAGTFFPAQVPLAFSLPELGPQARGEFYRLDLRLTGQGNTLRTFRVWLYW